MSSKVACSFAERAVQFRVGDFCPLYCPLPRKEAHGVPWRVQPLINTQCDSPTGKRARGSRMCYRFIGEHPPRHLHLYVPRRHCRPPLITGSTAAIRLSSRTLLESIILEQNGSKYEAGFSSRRNIVSVQAFTRIHAFFHPSLWDSRYSFEPSFVFSMENRFPIS